MSPAGYDAFYAISASGMNADTEFNVAEDASVAQVRKAFRENLRKKTTNKKLLSSFASLVSDRRDAFLYNYYAPQIHRNA